MTMTWKEAVWAAVQRQSIRSPVVSREALIEVELEQIKKDTQSAGATPAQTLSRVLQELRDDSVLIFDGGGRYRIASGLVDVEVETAIATEVVRLQKARIGQGGFRAALDARWNGACPLTGVCERALLRASHIVPWNRCESEAERLEPDNGLLLSALWDAAFDRGLVSFADDGAALFSRRLEHKAASALLQAERLGIAGLNDGSRARLARHRLMHQEQELLRVD
jgi:hypothetical protein